MKKSNFTASLWTKFQSFLILSMSFLSITSLQASHLPVGQQPATPYIVPDNINSIEANNVIYFEDTKTAILETVGANCGTISYPFVDSGGSGAPFSDNGDDQAFTICLRNPMLQTFSVNFSNIIFDPNSAETLSVYDGDDINDPLIATYGNGDAPTVYPNITGIGDGSQCLTFVLKGLDFISSSEGFLAQVHLLEFAPSIVCQPFVDTDGVDENNDPVGLAGNSIVEIDDPNDVIPSQIVTVDWGCGIYDVPENTGLANPAYNYEVKISQNGGASIISSSGTATSDPQNINISGNDLAFGDNEVEIALVYNHPNGPDAGDGTIKASCTRNIVVTTPTVERITCNQDLNVEIDNDCQVEILAENGMDRLSLGLTAVDPNYCIDQNGDLVYDSADEAILLNNQSHISNNNTNLVSITIPGTYFYNNLDNGNCSGEIFLTDKTGPICIPFGDDEWNSPWDVDCDGIIELRTQANDPSGIDDLSDEYVLCAFIEANNGPELWFDILEATDADIDGNGTVDVFGDFLDCSGVDYIFFQDENFEICDLNDLNGLPNDETRYNANDFEICDVYRRTWFSVDKNGRQNTENCSQYVFSLRPRAHKLELFSTAEFSCEAGTNLAPPYFFVETGLENGGAGSGHTGLFNSFGSANNNAQYNANLNFKNWLIPPNTLYCKYACSFNTNPPITSCATSYSQSYFWTVVDWCDGSRIYDNFSQFVKISDNTAPQISLSDGSPAEGHTFEVLVNSDCHAIGNILSLSTMDNCSPDVSFIENVTIERIITSPDDEDIFISPFPNGGNLETDLPPGVNVEFPIGDYILTYFATDDCGNVSTARLVMQVKAPCPSLAVDWLNFKAELSSKREGVLTWSITNSIDNDHFIIEHATNGYDFIPIGKVNAKKTNSSIENYQFTDIAVQLGLNYYRIQQVDISGKSSYSTIQELYLNETDFNLQPNPTKDEINLRFGLNLEEKVEIEVFNTAGQLLYTQSFLVEDNGINLSFRNMNIQQAGVYWIRAKTNRKNLLPISVVKID